MISTLSESVAVAVKQPVNQVGCVNDVEGIVTIEVSVLIAESLGIIQIVAQQSINQHGHVRDADFAVPVNITTQDSSLSRNLNLEASSAQVLLIGYKCACESNYGISSVTTLYSVRIINACTAFSSLLEALMVTSLVLTV